MSILVLATGRRPTMASLTVLGGSFAVSTTPSSTSRVCPFSCTNLVSITAEARCRSGSQMGASYLVNTVSTWSTRRKKSVAMPLYGMPMGFCVLRKFVSATCPIPSSGNRTGFSCASLTMEVFRKWSLVPLIIRICIIVVPMDHRGRSTESTPRKACRSAPRSRGWSSSSAATSGGTTTKSSSRSPTSRKKLASSS